MEEYARVSFSVYFDFASFPEMNPSFVSLPGLPDSTDSTTLKINGVSSLPGIAITARVLNIRSMKELPPKTELPILQGQKVTSLIKEIFGLYVGD